MKKNANEWSAMAANSWTSAVQSKNNSVVVCWSSASSSSIHHPSTIQYENKHLKDPIIICLKNRRPGWVSCSLPTVPHVDPAPRFDHVPVVGNILHCHCRHVQCQSSNLLEGNINNLMEFSENFQKPFCVPCIHMYLESSKSKTFWPGMTIMCIAVANTHLQNKVKQVIVLIRTQEAKMSRGKKR